MPSTDDTTNADEESNRTGASGRERYLQPGRRDVLRAIGGGAVLAAGWSSVATAEGAPFGDGVNLMPSYYCSGDQDLGWDLMAQQTDIQSVRIEIEPFSFDEVVTTREDAKRWIDEASANGYDVVATYHHYPDNGAADPQAVQNAADFWAEHYQYLSQDSSFTINLMNEWGNHDVSASDYASAYDSAIQTVRSETSYADSIIVDAPGWGQETHRLAEATDQISDDDLILSAHVYGDGWNQEVNENLQPSHLDVLEETDYPCMIGEFGSHRSGPVDWSAVIDHANDLGWPVFAWAWNGDGSDDPMNMADPYWGDDCSADSYTTTPYFEEVYPKLQGDSGTGGTGGTGGSGGTGGTGGDTTPPSIPSDLTATGTTPTSIDLSWSAAGDPGGSGLAHYTVYVDGSVDHSVSAGSTTTTVSNLSTDTSYEVAVSAVDGSGNESAASDPLTATTDVGDGTSGDDGWWGDGGSSGGGWWDSGGSDGSSGWW